VFWEGTPQKDEWKTSISRLHFEPLGVVVVSTIVGERRASVTLQKD
jgi:hypothetical protein